MMEEFRFMNQWSIMIHHYLPKLSTQVVVKGLVNMLVSNKMGQLRSKANICLLEWNPLSVPICVVYLWTIPRIAMWTKTPTTYGYMVTGVYHLPNSEPNQTLEDMQLLGADPPPGFPAVHRIGGYPSRNLWWIYMTEICESRCCALSISLNDSTSPQKQAPPKKTNKKWILNLWQFYTILLLPVFGSFFEHIPYINPKLITQL